MAEKTRAYKAQTWFAVLVFAGIIGFVGWKIAENHNASSGGSSSNSQTVSDQQTGARVLRQFDADHGNGGNNESAYGAELDVLSGKCTNSTKDTARFVENSYTDLTSHGVTDETALTLLRHLDQSIPAGSQMDCQGVLAAYLVLRES